MSATTERPIFVFSAGWRAGSTLLQRLLCSHPDIMIWGENRAICQELEAADAKVTELQDLSRAQQERADGTLHQAWIPMINPDRSDWQEGVRRLFLSLYAEPSRGRGACRWGFKEVRHDLSTARFLRELFPNARFLLLIRNPVDCLASARATTKGGRGLLVEAGGARGFLDHWRRLAESFAEAGEADLACRIRYEDLVTDPETSIAEIASFIDVDSSGLDRRVFDRRLRGWKREPYLDREDRQGLCDPRLWEVAACHGYEPEKGAGVSKGSGSRRDERVGAIRRIVRAVGRILPRVPS